MIFGIGTDIVTVARIEAASARHGTAFAARILSAQELVEYATPSPSGSILEQAFCSKGSVRQSYRARTAPSCEPAPHHYRP